MIIPVMLVPRVYAVGASTIISATICDDFNAPELTAPADGLETTDASVQAAGTADPDMTVDILRNGAIAASVLADPDGTYAVSVPLVGGSNTLQASVTNDCSTTHASAETVAVTRIIPPEPPAPPVEPPVVPTVPPSTNPSVTPTPTPTPTPGTGSLYAPILNPIQTPKSVRRLWVDGIAPPGSIVSILVNGIIVANVAAADDGSFGALVTLRRGENVITAQISSSTHTYTSEESTVTYTPRTAAPTEPEPSINISILPVVMIIAGSGLFLWWLLLLHRIRNLHLFKGHHSGAH